MCPAHIEPELKSKKKKMTPTLISVSASAVYDSTKSPAQSSLCQDGGNPSLSRGALGSFMPKIVRKIRKPEGHAFTYFRVNLLHAMVKHSSHLFQASRSETIPNLHSVLWLVMNLCKCLMLKDLCNAIYRARPFVGSCTNTALVEHKMHQQWQECKYSNSVDVERWEANRAPSSNFCSLQKPLLCFKVASIPTRHVSN